MTLTDEQQAAFDAAVALRDQAVTSRTDFKPKRGQPWQVPVLVVVGFAGTGKSYLFEILGDHFSGNRANAPVVAPTGKAAQRLRKGGLSQASTIHRLIYTPEVDPNTGDITFIRNEMGFSLRSDEVLLVDEGSMIARDVWVDLVEAAHIAKAPIVVAGDGFQLPPVVPKGTPEWSVLTGTVPGTTRELRQLTKIHRQAEGSPIITASMLLRHHRASEALQYLPVIPGDKVLDVANAVVNDAGFIIAHTNNTRISLTHQIRMSRGFDAQLRANEPLMVTRNNYAVNRFNGEIVQFRGWLQAPSGYWRAHNKYKGTSSLVQFGVAEVVAPDDPTNTSTVVLCPEEIAGTTTADPTTLGRAAKQWAKQEAPTFTQTVSAYDRDLERTVEVEVPVPHLSCAYGYVSTCHKAQGSQAPAVLVIMEPSIRLHQTDGLRWLYTAVTRASSTVAVAYAE